MRSSSVLLVGARGLSGEIGKNLVLAGIGSLTLLDGSTVTISDLAASFLFRESDLGRNRALASVEQLAVLNPNVRVEADSRTPEEVIEREPRFFAQFRAVCVVGQSLAVQTRINELLREHGAAVLAAVADAPASAATPVSAVVGSAEAAAIAAAPSAIVPAYFSAECLGLFAFFFEDLQRHSYTETRRARDADTGKETDEEHVISGTAVYARTARQVLEEQALASLPKAFGRKRQEKSAALVWIAVRVLLQWREQQMQLAAAAAAATGSVSVAPLPPLSDPAALASLLLVRDAAAAREKLDPESLLPRAVLLEVGRGLGGELAHVCAVVGGILGQEILKVLSGKDAPLANTFVYAATVGERPRIDSRAGSG